MVSRILVIDDDHERLGHLEFGLTVLGYTVIAEIYRNRLIDKIKNRPSEFPVDLLIAPTVIQGESIYFLIERLCDQGFCLPAIAISEEKTENSFEEPQSGCHRAVNFIKEPFTLNQLKQLIDTISKGDNSL